MVVFTFFFTTVVFLTSQNTVIAADCTIIKIQGGGKDGVSTAHGRIIAPDPSTLHVTGGTCVIWVNFAQATEVRVNFRDGKTCADVTEAPTGFTLNSDQCYVTNYIPLGQTSSLVFNEEGVYEYTIEYGVEQTSTGKIIVKEGTGVPKKVAVQEEAPMDTDGDGVPDSEDKCPDTPKGATVNKMGCWALKGLVLFDFDKSDIKPEAYPLLNEVAVILEKNPEIKAEIDGHTDNMGPDAYNQQLSENRAKAVEAYLEGKGIDPSRLTSKGYGASSPIATNDTMEGRQENRRVELKKMR